MNRRRLACLAAASWILLSERAPGAETDNLTYRYLPLEDSASKLNRIINATLDLVLKETNEQLRAGDVSDTETELIFARTYIRIVMRRFGDRLLPLFGTCIERNDCPDWPRFERIVLEPAESTYGEAGYNRVATTFLSPTFQLCGVRMGTDKLTHLFSQGFFYYNAGRVRGARPSDVEEARRMALADERGLMGARSTSVISPADAEATTAGYRLARDYFLGDDPVFARDPGTGLLRRRRDVDLCGYVSEGFDEVVNPPSFTARRGRVARLEAAIEERRTANERTEGTLTPREKRELKETIVRRSLDPEHGRLPWTYKIYLVFKYIAAYLTMSRESREAASFMVFPDFKLKDRLPILLKREPPAGAGRSP